MGAAFWHFAELDGSTRRQDTSAGPEICRVSGADHQRPSQTGRGFTEHTHTHLPPSSGQRAGRLTSSLFVCLVLRSSFTRPST